MASIYDVARPGLVHHMIHPNIIFDPPRHVDTLIALSRRPDIGAFDCCLPYDPALRARAAEGLKGCGKSICYACHMLPHGRVRPATEDFLELSLLKLFYENQIEAAVQIGATGFIFVSGPDYPEAERPAAMARFAEFVRWFCEKLRPHGITAMLEPFDRFVDKRFLYGSIDECAALMRDLSDIPNLAIELDFGHLPLMGEPIDHAVQTLAPYIRRVHLGNCVLRDPKHPLYGDKHPPIGLPGGENARDALRRALAALAEIGFLSPEAKGDLLIEMTPFPGRDAEYTIAQQFELLEEVWAELCRE